MLNRSHDLRIMLYRSVKTLLIAIGVAFLLKITAIDSIRGAGKQMYPTIESGDRLVIFRTPFFPVLGRLFPVPYDRPVAYESVMKQDFFDILRVAAASGDTIRLDSGKVLMQRELPRIHEFEKSLSDIVPEEYSPRDFFNTYRIPGHGDIIFLNRLSLRDFFFAKSIIEQEHPRKPVSISPYLLLNDSISKNYIITDFAFYSGHIDSVPDSLHNDWFFWNRLEEYLYQKHDEQKVSLYFTLSLDGTVIDEYTVKHQHLFLLADNRKRGLDSRYFGPVSRKRCLGTAVMVLWSSGADDNGRWKFRFNRMGRFIQ
jgi:hypothetical protein